VIQPLKAVTMLEIDAAPPPRPIPPDSAGRCAQLEVDGDLAGTGRRVELLEID
jgi:hypothetical protein